MDEFGGSDGFDLGSVDDSLGDVDSIDSFDSVDSSIEDIEGSDTDNIEDIEDMDEASEIPEDIEELDSDEDIEDLELPDDIDPDDIEVVEEPEDIENLEIDDTDMTGDELEDALEQEQLDEDLDELLGDMSTDEIDVTDVEEEPLEDSDQDIEESEELDDQEDITEDEELPDEEPLEEPEEADQDIEESEELDNQEDTTEDEELPDEESLEDTEEADQDIEESEDLDNQEDTTEDEELSEEEPLEDPEENQDIEETEDLDNQEDIIEDEEVPEEEPLEDQDIEKSEDLDDKEVNRPSWELSPEEKEDILSKQDEVSKEYREEHGLDEQGRSLEGKDEDNTLEDESERTHGEDGERTRYSDLQSELKTNYEVNYEPMESSSGHSWELTPEEKELVLSNQAEVSETYRNKHNLDEHGDKIDNLKDDLDELVDDKDLQRLKDEVDYLDSNTSEMFENNEEESMSLDYSKEELQDIWDNDPGYVNEKAYRNLDEIDEGYKETGNHSEGLLNYGKDAVENTEKETMLPEGKILERYGSEQGRYLTDPGTQYEDLHLIVSEDKLPSQTYEVVKPFRVTESEIADQPFDEDIKENKENKAMQYKSSICVEDLIELGFLKRIDHE